MLGFLSLDSDADLVIIAAIGLRQLTIARENAQMNAKRESFRLAAEQRAYYSHHVIPLLNKLDAAIRAKGITFFSNASVEVRGEEVKINSPMTPADAKALLTIAPELTEAYNALEAFGLYFTSGVADEQVAFSAVGTTYCYSVRKLLPDLVRMATDKKAKYMNHVLELFFLWNSRFEAETLQAEKRRIDAELSGVTGKFIRPIGA